MYLQLKWQFPVCYLGLSLPLRKTVRVQMVLSEGKVKGQMFVLFSSSVLYTSSWSQTAKYQSHSYTHFHF